MALRIPSADLIGAISLIWLGFVTVAAAIILGLQRWRRAHPPKPPQTYAKELPRRFGARRSPPRRPRWTRRLRSRLRTLLLHWVRRP